jgi:thioredoxin 1
MVFREGVGVFRQAGALPAPQLEELISGVRGLDMEDVHAKVAEQQKKMAEEQAAKESQQGTGGAPGTSPTDF